MRLIPLSASEAVPSVLDAQGARFRTTEAPKVDPIISEAMRRLALRRAQSLTPQQREAVSAKAIAARWSKTTAKERSTQAKERWKRMKAKAAETGQPVRRRRKRAHPKPNAE
jgi:hypothetical protein